MIYLTRTRLMDESERSVQERAVRGDDVPRRVCSQLIADAPRYALWHTRHEGSMTAVAGAKRRERQLLALRSISVEQVHRTALIRYLREYRITGTARDNTLRAFYGIVDTRCAALAEHRNFLMAASSQICAVDLLELAGDDKGVELIRRYEITYGQYFSMFCDQSRAAQRGAAYLLSGLIPEIKANAERSRQRILTGHLLRPPPFSRSAYKTSAARR